MGETVSDRGRQFVEGVLDGSVSDMASALSSSRKPSDSSRNPLSRSESESESAHPSRAASSVGSGVEVRGDPYQPQGKSFMQAKAEML